MSRRIERPARSIAWPIFALVIVSVVVAALTIFAVTFNGPPRTAGRRGQMAVQALRTGLAPASEEGRLHVSTSPAKPSLRGAFHVDPAARARLAATLGAATTDVAAYTMRGGPEGGGPTAPGWRDDGDFGRDFLIAWRTGGQWRSVETPRPWLAPWHLTTLLAMAIAVLALAIPAWFIARAISQPLRALALAAEQARVGAALPPLPRRGAREVRALSHAVAAMHARLAGHAEGRTTMLAAIAHDLGTPLSRLAFRCEALPDTARERAAADIAEMRAMIAAALSFARDETADVTVRLDLGSLLDSMAEDLAENGARVTVLPGPRAIVRGDPGALRRLFVNLVENALRYGGEAALSWGLTDRTVEVVIDDRGPGIDPATVERLFEPFVRGDPSRNRATGGTGLGLAIVRSIAGRHGGEAVLENGPTGARARVTLPLA